MKQTQVRLFLTIRSLNRPVYLIGDLLVRNLIIKKFRHALSFKERSFQKTF